MSHVPQLCAAIGDSFTEGVGDELPDGTVRGWADFVALGLAAAAHEPIGYANLAIRGRKLGPIVDEQLEMAIGLHPEVISFNGGGNDMLRPRMPEERVADRFRQAVHRIRGAGIHVLMLSGANPTDHLPLGRVRRTRSAPHRRTRRPRPARRRHVRRQLQRPRAARHPLLVARQAAPQLARPRARREQRAHGPGVAVPDEWGVAEVAAAPPGTRSRNTAAYYREFVLPWIGRRLTGRSSGDGRAAKRPTLEPLAPDAAR